jgi:hypothetical protein
MEFLQPPKSFFFKGQLLHLLLLAVLLAASFWLANAKNLESTTRAWFIASISIPVVHQVFVWLAWRSELCFSAITKARFPIYGIVFMVLLISRPLAVLGLAISDQESIELPVAVRIAVPILLAIPAIYTFYSVARYFGVSRAMGIDHFDPNYRDAPLVKEGIFKWASNSMYVFGFFIFWVIAIAFSSKAALVAAGFNHAYIWVHYFCTERPDMSFIYGENE